MIVLFSDFGPAGPYVGQMKAVLYRELGAVPLVDLCSDAPVCNPRAAAYLLAACAPAFPDGSIFLAVVDPGVGSSRRAAAVRVDGRWFVGPDNGLFNVVAMWGNDVQWWDISWRPPALSASFHGRDLFAPVVARLARGEAPPGDARAVETRLDPGWPQDLAEVIYVDHFGNVMTGLRGSAVPQGAVLEAQDVQLPPARTFSDVPVGTGFWYVNANGLVEIAVNQGRADQALGLRIGDALAVKPPP